MLLTLGWIATSLYLLAQAYVSFIDKWRRDAYYSVNIIAALFLTISSVALQSWQAVFVNTFWMIVSILSLKRRVYFRTFPNRIEWSLGVTILLILVSVFGLFTSTLFAAEILGWGGTFLFCGAYLSFATRRISRLYFLLLNALASLILLPSYFYDLNWPSFMLNIVWIAISLMGYWRLFNSTK